MKALNLSLLLLLLIIGCDSQSPNAKFIDGDGTSIGLVGVAGLPLSALDAWWVKPDSSGSEIYSASFGYKCTLEVDGVEVNGIKVLCRITNYGDPTGGDYDIWDKTAPNGKKYGFVASQPPGSWDYGEGIASTRTGAGGKCIFFIGLGSPVGTLVPDFDWPGGCGTMVSTMVEVKFVIPKWNGNIEKECYMYFVRAQCGDFWEPYPYGVIDNSHSYLVKYPNGTYSMSGEGVTIKLEQVDIMPEKTTKTAAPLAREWKPPTTWQPSLTSPILPFTSTAEVSESWEYLKGHWEQYNLVWCGCGMPWYPWDWHWHFSPAEELVVLWMADPADPCDGAGLVSYAEPYAFFCKVQFYMESEVVDVIFTHIHTVILKSKDEFGDVAAWLPINMYVYDIQWPYYHYIYLWSNGVVAIEHTAGQGYYRDYWGYPFAVIYVPDNGYLEIEVDDFYGDFNFDGVVNFVDYAMLLNYMGKGLTDEYYNLMYDADHDGQTTTKDLAIFFQKKPRVNLVSFAKFADDWLNGNGGLEGLGNLFNKWLKPQDQNWLKTR